MLVKKKLRQRSLHEEYRPKLTNINIIFLNIRSESNLFLHKNFEKCNHYLGKKKYLYQIVLCIILYTRIYIKYILIKQTVITNSEIYCYKIHN